MAVYFTHRGRRLYISFPFFFQQHENLKASELQKLRNMGYDADFIEQSCNEIDEFTFQLSLFRKLKFEK